MKTLSNLRGIWASMKHRCLNPKSKEYKNYGGRGILICERWMTYANFAEDMGPRPSFQHSIDRIDNNGNYEPGNCRWATRKEQANNKRTTIRLTLEGETKTLTEVFCQSGVTRGTVYRRIKSGASPEQALDLVHDSRNGTFRCPHCGGLINLGRIMGSAKSKAKAKASRENGKLGGRPKKQPSTRKQK